MTALLEAPLAPPVTAPADVVVLGATGDLFARKLLPALARLEAEGLLPAGARVVGVGRRPLDDAWLRGRAAEALAGEPVAVREALLGRLAYAQADVAQDASPLAGLLAAGRRRLFHLACAPDLFVPACRALGAAGLVDDAARVLVEKPLGTDLPSAVAVNAGIAEVFAERQVLRVDHYLGKGPVQDLLALRLAGPAVAPAWDARTVAAVEVTVTETLGVGGRGGYYDRAGALRDMVQNHLLQLLCLVAMPAPASSSPDAVRDAKVSVLRALQPWTRERVAGSSRRGQYGPGSVDGQPVPGYREECGDPASTTETCAVLSAELADPRWQGVPFLLRTGKRLDRAAAEVVVRFRPGAPAEPPARLVVGLADGVRVEPGAAGRALRLRADGGAGGDGYAQLLADALADDPTRFLRRDEVEASWAWVDPLRAAWDVAPDDPAAPLLPYAAGTAGPVLEVP